VGVAKTPALEAPVRVNNGFADRVISAATATAIVEAYGRASSRAIQHHRFHSHSEVCTSELPARLNLPIVRVALSAENDPDVKGFV
jgi:hypothetical protein